MNDESEIFFKTGIKDAMDPLPEVSNQFGILDLKSVLITETPNFTEDLTLRAFEILHLVPQDIVFDPLTDYSGDPSLQLQVSIDLEQKRILNIKKIISTRERLLNGKQISRIPNFKPKKKNKNTELILTNRRSKSTARATKPIVPSSRTTNSSMALDTNRSRSVMKREELKREHDKLVKQRALIRLKKQEETVAHIEAQRERSRALSKIELKKQAEAINKLKEKKLKQYEQEQKWRKENIYKQSFVKPSQHSSITNLRKKLILAQHSERRESKSVTSIPYSKQTKIPRLIKK